jgi:tetratricopeptide (TPR) repeat protein
MNRKITILSSLFLLLMMANAQIPNLTDQKIVDSLFILLPQAEETAKVDVLNQLALHLAPRSYDSSFQYASEALTLSEKLDYLIGKGIAIFNIGNSYYFTADYKSAILNYLKALRILESFEPHKEMADLLLMLGALNQYVNNIEKAKQYLLLAARTFGIIGDTSSMTWAFSLISVTYNTKLSIIYQNDTVEGKKIINTMMDSAIKYHSITLKYYLQPNPQCKLLSPEENLVDAYNFMGQLYLTKTDSIGLCDSLGLDCLLKGLDVSHKIKDPIMKIFYEGAICMNLGYNYYFQTKNKDKGYKFALLGAEKLKKSIGYDQYAFALDLLGYIEMDKGNYRKAQEYLDLALSMSDTFLLEPDRIRKTNALLRLTGVPNMHRGRCDIYYDLEMLNKKTDNFEKALFYRRKLQEERKILALDETNRQMTALQIDYEDEIQNQQIELAQLRLNRSRLWFAGIGSTIVIAFLLIFLYFQRKKYSTEQNALLLKQRLLRSQMNPHFIFNSLSGIQNFIVTEKPTKASIYLSKFATLVRNILDSSVKEYVTLEKEITTIENYLELQKVRYSGKFDFSIKTDDAIDPETTMIPPMLAQPFIENAIEHGIVHSDKTGQIDVEFRLEDDVILFEVTDNGVGREKARELEAHLEKDHHSMSTSITLERLAMLNKKRKHKIIFEITDLKDNDGNAVGTFVRFGIPLGNDEKVR